MGSFGEIIHGESAYLVAIWLILTNVVSYTSKVQYTKAHSLGFSFYMPLLCLFYLIILLSLVPLMACNTETPKVPKPN